MVFYAIRAEIRERGYSPQHKCLTFKVLRGYALCTGSRSRLCREQAHQPAFGGTVVPQGRVTLVDVKGRKASASKIRARQSRS